MTWELAGLRPLKMRDGSSAWRVTLTKRRPLRPLDEPSALAGPFASKTDAWRAIHSWVFEAENRLRSRNQ
jgi:hypothetical protein